MCDYKPPFHVTDRIVSYIAEISEQVGRIAVLQEGTVSPHLRRENRIRTIHSSLAIEHNSLSLEQVTAIVDGKRVLGNPNEIKMEGMKNDKEILCQIKTSKRPPANSQRAFAGGCRACRAVWQRI